MHRHMYNFYFENFGIFRSIKNVALKTVNVLFGKTVGPKS